MFFVITGTFFSLWLSANGGFSVLRRNVYIVNFNIVYPLMVVYIGYHFCWSSVGGDNWDFLQYQEGSRIAVSRKGKQEGDHIYWHLEIADKRIQSHIRCLKLRECLLTNVTFFSDSFEVSNFKVFFFCLFYHESGGGRDKTSFRLSLSIFDIHGAMVKLLPFYNSKFAFARCFWFCPPFPLSPYIYPVFTTKALLSAFLSVLISDTGQM